MNFLTFIFKNLLRRPARSLLTIVGLAVAIGGVVSLVGVATGFERSFMDVYTSRDVDMVVNRAGGSETINNTLPQQLGDRIAKLPGVQQVIGGLLDALSFPEHNIIGAIVNGWAPDCPLFNRLTLLSGRQLQDGDQKKAMLGRVLAANLHKKIGDTVQLYAQDFEVVGIYESPVVFENSGAVMLLDEMQKQMNRPNEISGFTVTVKKPIDEKGMDELRQRIEALQPNIKATPSAEFVKNVTQIRVARAVAWLISAIAVFIGGIGMLNTMIMSVFERTKEIGTLRAIGWKKARIVRMVIGESLILSVVGAALGSIAGAALAKVVGLLPAAAAVTQGNVAFPVFIQGFAVALVVGLVGAIYPALWSANLLPTEALRR
jgi:putative ABC transport system permease protein